MDQANVYKYVDRFKSCQTSIRGETRSECLEDISGPSLESRTDGLMLITEELLLK